MLPAIILVSYTLAKQKVDCLSCLADSKKWHLHSPVKGLKLFTLCISDHRPFKASHLCISEYSLRGVTPRNEVYYSWGFFSLNPVYLNTESSKLRLEEVRDAVPSAL